MILLSETTTYKYYGIEVPRDAKEFELSFDWNMGTWLLFYWKTNSIELPIKSKPEILGVIGPEDSIYEEIGAEMFEDYYDLGMSTYHRIKNKLGPEGILIENPIEKPEEMIVGDKNGMGIVNASYPGKLKQWQSYESKLKKVVIIKVKA